MKRLKWTACVVLLIANFSSTFANSNELFTNAIPQTLDLPKPSDLYSRKDFDPPREKGTTYLTASLLLMAPQIPLFPNDRIASGSRIAGGVRSKIGGMEISYTSLASSFLFDSEYVFNRNPNERLQVNAQFSLKSVEGVLKVPHTLGFLGEGVLFQGIYGVEYAKTARSTQYVYKETAYSNPFTFSKLEGVGPLLGFLVEKPLSNTFSMTGGVSQSFLKGSNRWRYSDKFEQYTPVTKVQVGLDWNIGDVQKQFFQLSTRYEAQCWFNEGFAQVGKKQNLVLQGLNLQGTFNF